MQQVKAPILAPVRDTGDETAVEVQKYQAIFLQTGWSFVRYHLAFAQAHQDDFESLEQEFDNFQTVRTWLEQRKNNQSAWLLVELTQALTPFLRRPEFAAELLGFCQSGLEASRALGTNPGWLYLLQFDAHNYLGDWDQALADAKTAIAVTQEVDPEGHAQAVLALGKLLFNRGDYQDALATLKKAEYLLTQVSDIEGVAAVRAEFAAYHLNRGELEQALALYLEVDQLRRQVNPNGSTDHTLLMLGVVYRNKGDYEKGSEYLEALVERGKRQNKPGAIATASHHLAWLHLRTQNFAEARRLATQAKQLYLNIRDPRGASDTDEQLGLIALLDNDLEAAELHLQHSLTIRRSLDNKQGMANTLGLLADLYARQRKIRPAISYLWRSWVTYHHLGVLTRHQMLKKVKQLWQLAVVKQTA